MKDFPKRRNWLFADTVCGTKVSAHLYRLVQTARANEVEPNGYLRGTDKVTAQAIADWHCWVAHENEV